MREPQIPEDFTRLLDECSGLIAASGVIEEQRLTARAEPLPSLLEQCREITELTGQAEEPIRTIHHFACTGGTLISKCLASMPNVQLLSEVAPYSRMGGSGSGFTPTDLIRLLRSSSRGSDSALEYEIFLRGINAIREQCSSTGIRLVIREHSHSKFCFGDTVLGVPSMVNLLADFYPLRSLVTVRHPLDSYLSLVKQDWLTFEPNSLDEYSKRYLEFLAEHEGLLIIRYEDFVSDTEKTMQSVCLALDLPYYDGFIDTFSALSLSGDSGRSSPVISERERRPVPEGVVNSSDSEHFSELCRRLGYDSNLDAASELSGQNVDAS